VEKKLRCKKDCPIKRTDTFWYRFFLCKSRTSRYNAQQISDSKPHTLIADGFLFDQFQSSVFHSLLPPHPDPGINERTEDIRDQVAQNDQSAGQYQHGHNHRVVQTPDGGGEIHTDAGPREDGFRDDCTGDQHGQSHTQLSDHGQEHILGHMPQQNGSDAGTKSLLDGDRVLVKLVDGGAADIAGKIRQETDDQNRVRQYQMMQEILKGILAKAVHAHDREQVQLQSERIDKQQRHKEGRYRQTNGGKQSHKKAAQA